MLEGWTSGSRDVDNFIKDTIYDARNKPENPIFLEWVPFDKFTDIKQIRNNESSKREYIATWIDGHSFYKKPIRVALKNLTGPQPIMTAYYLKKVCFCYYYYYYSIVLSIY
jgi:hypothetical protein